MVHSKGDVSSKLTPAEQDVLRLITEEFLTPVQVAIRRQTSRTMVYRIIRILKRKGAITVGSQMVHKNRGTTTVQSTKRQQVRLHAQEFNIKIINQDSRYDGRVGKLITVDGNRVKCSRHSVEVYSDQSFFGDDVQSVTSKSFQYWGRFFTRLEHDLQVILVRPRSQNITLVKHEYAEINNELARDIYVKKEALRIYTKDDGKLWFIIDNSFNLHEAEAVHPIDAQQDMEGVKAHFNDIRENTTLLPSDILKLLGRTDKQLFEVAAGLNAIVKLNKPQTVKEELKPRATPEYIG